MEPTYHRKLRAVQVTGALVMGVFEAFVLAEILWYYLHDGTQTLHEAIAEYVEEHRERRADIRDMRASIRDLPETDS